MNAKRLLLLLLLAGTVAVALIGRSGSSSSREYSSALDRDIAKAFHIFRAPTEDLSGAEERRIDAALETSGSEKLLRSQLAETGQGRLWVFDTPRLICISHTRGLACAPKRQALQGGVVLGVFDPPSEGRHGLHNFLVQGVVPDDVRRVLVVVDNRRHMVIDVKENVFSIAASKPIHVKRLLRH